MVFRFAAAPARTESSAAEPARPARSPDLGQAAPHVGSHIETLRQGAVLARERLSQLRALAPDEHEDGVNRRRAGYCWTGGRIALAQEVWGEGFVAPGGTGMIMDLIEPLDLKRGMTVLELGAGLGGSTRIMAGRLGAWVTGMEWDRGLAEAGMALSARAGMARTAPVYRPGGTAGRMVLKSFDRFFSMGRLFTLQDRSRLLHLIGAVLRDHGELLFTDYVLAAPQRPELAVEVWTAAEPEAPELWSAGDYVKLFSALGLHIRVDDITERLCTAVNQSWADFHARIEQAGVDPVLAPVLANEAALWTRRAALLENGELNVCRFHVARRL